MKLLPGYVLDKLSAELGAVIEEFLKDEAPGVFADLTLVSDEGPPIHIFVTIDPLASAIIDLAQNAGEMSGEPNPTFLKRGGPIRPQ